LPIGEAGSETDKGFAVPASLPLDSQHPTYQAVLSSVAGQATIGGILSNAWVVIETEGAKLGRTLIDTPEERQQFERIVVGAVNAALDKLLGAAATGLEMVVDPWIASKLDALLTKLAAATPAASPIGSASP
jgi:1-aminocyclopropane-1-carboxylate deaminase/D-cysteine desulfhydrase-like pyridoxal-dependent ACC family enzyme